MELNLKKPIIFFDLETTGLNIVKDRIIEISAIKICLNGDQEIKTRRLKPVDAEGNQMKLPKEVVDLTHITDEDLADKPTFKEIAKSLAEWMKGCDLGGYNSNRFDIPLLAEEFLRADVDIDLRKSKFVDVQVIFNKKEQRTLTAAYKFYCHKDLEGAHGAEADITATYEVLKAQLDRYPDLQNDMEFLSEYSSHNNNVDFAGRFIYNEKKEEIINFGKYKGRKVAEVLLTDPGYYGWIMQSDFTLDTKRVLTQLRFKYGLR
ncbi:MAG: 3'-5' exonuclease [Paludibacteraceae bacterium]|nr:3'-5' exonuclease [Paludibacteraceae bacterium]MBO7635329.1 3'-5' exonuclease [Paludibacteraceae bacterium]MBR5973002.1 3'-5' exonuclease [Paludibacteraceae bacterium]